MKYIVLSKESKCTLFKFLKLKIGNKISGKQIKKAIDNNLCTINESVTRISTCLLNTGDTVNIKIDKCALLNTPKKHFKESHVLYEDKDLLLYNKMPGIDSYSLNKLLLPYCKSLQLVHRLDRDTSGIIIMAKNKKTLNSMIYLFSKAKIIKTYLAIVSGHPSNNNGEIISYLKKIKSRHGEVIWGSVKKGGKYAKTRWQFLKKNQYCTLVRCWIETGRTHQIRVHFKEMGNPIVGDYRYGQYFEQFSPHHLLHAESIKFIHPHNDKLIHITVNPPQQFMSYIT